MGNISGGGGAFLQARDKESLCMRCRGNISREDIIISRQKIISCHNFSPILYWSSTVIQIQPRFCRRFCWPSPVVTWFNLTQPTSIGRLKLTLCDRSEFNLVLALFPGSFERAWYTLTAHECILTTINAW